MKQTIRLLALALTTSILLCSCGNDYTLDIYGSIEGRVADVTTGEPIKAAQVTLLPSSKTIQTSDNGVFSFAGLDEGKYTVSVQKDGYQSNRKDITVVSGENSEIVITLKVIPKN